MNDKYFQFFNHCLLLPLTIYGFFVVVIIVKIVSMSGEMSEETEKRQTNIFFFILGGIGFYLLSISFAFLIDILNDIFP